MAAADRGLLRNRAFLAIWGAQILSQVASNAVTSALIILVAEITHSNTSSSVLILLAVLPAILFGIAGGVIVDRTDRRLVLIITNALRAAAVGGTRAGSPSTSVRIWWVAAISARWTSDSRQSFSISAMSSPDSSLSR